MNSGETSYVWQLGNQTEINTYRGVGAASTQFCKVNVVATPAGIVTQLHTEDANIYTGLTVAIGVDIKPLLTGPRPRGPHREKGGTHS